MEPKTLLYVIAAIAAAYFLFFRSRGDINGTEARDLVANGALLLDVRTPGEYAGGHIDGAINIPLDQLASRLSELPDRERTIVLYCQSGRRSASATKLLTEAGYGRAKNLGGIGAW
ncbi:MAG: rhodanese-like domain-containing protein [Myxococcales bacterium]|nr:rhodanese-like domain-containing protein [Myxococcales bacterium]